VILVDANILVYAHMRQSERHVEALDWLDERLSRTDAVGLPWGSLLAFLRVTTSRRVFSPPSPMDVAWAQVTDWLAADPVWVPSPTRRHTDILGTLLAETSAHSNLVPDAHLAALAIEHGLVLCSSDRDFRRFKGLRWENPISA
jgi:toxin-antitoxin system PIN domain toxin